MSDTWQALCRGAALEAELDDAVVQRVAAIWDEVSRRWSTELIATIACDRFAAALGRGLRDRSPDAWLDALDVLHGEDVYLALAASREDPAALRAIDGRIRRAASGVGTRMREDSQDIAQMIRVRVFDRDEGGEVRIAQYSGRGTLESWLRVVGTRVLLNARRRTRPEVVADRSFAEPITTSTPELAVMRAESQATFLSALRAAFERLGEDDRALLEESLVAGKTVTELGRELGVHHATAARWLVRARERLLAGFHEELRGTLGDSLEARQLIAVLRSRVAFEDRELFEV